ncbi:MAG: peptidylprolyl isomerase [Holophaga sp.]|nr:peptidylprolyl isomerase [Holophaga sp.]
MFKPLIPLISMSLLAQSPAPRPPAPRPSAPMLHGGPQQQGPELPEPKAGDPIAYLGARTVTYGEFASWLKLMAGPRTESILKSSATRGQAQKQYLELLVLAAKGQKENLQNTQEFKSTLAALRMQCFARVLLDDERVGGDAQKIKAKAENPTEAEVRAYFQANSERYATPERFTARHILVGLKGAPGVGDKGLSDDEAKAKAAKVEAELKAGKKFEDLAKEYSDDPGSKNNGGLYKDIPYGRFAKEFEAAVRAQEIGKVGEPVKSSFGYHIILVEARNAKQPGDFDKLKDGIRRQMVPERREKLTREFMDQARKDLGFREVVPPAPAPKAPAPQAVLKP